MKFDIIFEENRKFFIITTEGDFNIHDFEDLANQLLNDPKWYPGVNCIFDYRKTDFIKVGLKDLVKSKSIHTSQNTHIGRGKSAFVMKDSANLSVGRMYKSMMSPAVSTEFCIFTDFEKAKQWAL